MSKIKSLIFIVIFIILILLNNKCQAESYGCEIILEYKGSNTILQGESKEIDIIATKINSLEGILLYNAVLEYDKEKMDIEVTGSEEWELYYRNNNTITLNRKDLENSKEEQVLGKIIVTAKIDTCIDDIILSNGEVTDGNEIFQAKESSLINVVLSDIEIIEEPIKMKYMSHENFDSTGMKVMATYNNGETEETTNYTIVNGENLTCQVTKIEIQSNENSEIKDEIEIEVAHDMKEATCIEPAKCMECNYTEGEALGHNYENGECTRCGEDSPEITVTSEKYTILENYITKISPKTTVQSLKANLQTNAGGVEVYNKNNELVEEGKILATGMKVKFELYGRQQEYIIVVTGDTNGDGESNFSDILQINKHRLNKVSLVEEYLKAGDVTGDGKADFTDILQINKYRLGKTDSL